MRNASQNVVSKEGMSISFIQNKVLLSSKGNTLTHPYGIYIWQPPQSQSDKGTWLEPLQVYTQEFALYVANLIHIDSRAVIKVVHNGITLANFPDEKTVQLVEQQIAKQQEKQ